jgi:hypothetical protein
MAVIGVLNIYHTDPYAIMDVESGSFFPTNQTNTYRAKTAFLAYSDQMTAK